MDELQLVGLHEDGEHVVLAAPGGEHLRLRIDEALRAAVRRDRPQLEHLRDHGRGTIPPREIQAQIRAGRSAEELVETAGLTLEQVRRFEGPVLAERAFIAEQARATRVGRDPGAPVLGDLVTDRLAARGVAQQTVGWDACRAGSGPWTVIVRFAVGDQVRDAQWSFDAQSRSLHAVDDEARWLSETELHDEPIPRRHLAAVRDVLYDIEADGGVRPSGPGTTEPEPLVATDPVHPPDQDGDATASLLHDLREQRGVRQQLESGPDLEDDDDLTDQGNRFGPQHAFDFASSDQPDGRGYDTPALPGLEDLPGEIPAAHPPASRAQDAQDSAILTLPDPLGVKPAPAAPLSDEPVPAGRPRSGRKARASVPSWDEIVFGAKPE